MKSLSLFWCICWAVAASAQSDLTLYNFNAIPQSLHTNPGYPQQAKGWVGLPVLSGTHFHYHNSGFALIDLLETGTDINANFDKLLLEMDDKSQLAIRQDIDLLGVGFKLGKGFWTLGATQTIDYRMDYPVELLRLIKYGNAPEEFRDASLNEFDYELVNRTNFYLGYQHQLNDKLSLGGRFKYVVGQQHAYAARTNAGIYTSDNSTLRIESDILFRTAGISGYLDNPLELSVNTFLPENRGFAMDLGGTYQLNEKWSFSASLLDLGYIKWTGKTRDYISEGTFEFDGFDADLSSEQPIESYEQIIDSLRSAFNFEEVDGNSYKRALASRVFLGGNYHFSDKHALGAVYHLRRWQDENFHDISLNYQGRLSRTFQYSVSYSVINGTYNNLGAGFSLKLGPVQLYVISDNVLHSMMYEHLQTSNVRLGINLTFYGKRDKSVPTEEKEAIPPSDKENE